MRDEQDRKLDAARELLRELESPSAYELLGVSRDTPSSELLGAFMRAFQETSKSGRSPQALGLARDQLKDAHRRLEVDMRFLDRDTWQHELEILRNRFAMVDFLKDFRG